MAGVGRYPTLYLACTQPPIGQPFSKEELAERAAIQADPKWDYRELPLNHLGLLYAPEVVAAALVPAINGVDDLLGWWLTDVRHQFGDDCDDPDAPLLPSERHDRFTGRPARAGADALRSGLAGAVQQWLPTREGQLTPHVLRHYCATPLYHRGMALKAVQELLGHEWLKTTTVYVHVHDNYIEQAWAAANDRVSDRFELVGSSRDGSCGGRPRR